MLCQEGKKDNWYENYGEIYKWIEVSAMKDLQDEHTAYIGVENLSDKLEDQFHVN